MLIGLAPLKEINEFTFNRKMIRSVTYSLRLFSYNSGDSYFENMIRILECFATSPLLYLKRHVGPRYKAVVGVSEFHRGFIGVPS